MIIKDVVLWFRSVESISELNLDYRPVVFKLGIDSPSRPPTKTITNLLNYYQKIAKLIKTDYSPVTDHMPGIIDSVDIAKEAAAKSSTFIQHALYSYSKERFEVSEKLRKLVRRKILATGAVSH